MQLAMTVIFHLKFHVVGDCQTQWCVENIGLSIS